MQLLRLRLPLQVLQAQGQVVAAERHVRVVGPKAGQGDGQGVTQQGLGLRMPGQGGGGPREGSGA